MVPASVCVVVPVYNGARTLPACLDALLVAIPAGTHVVIVDDASTDGSGDLARARGVTVITHAAQVGPSAARNTGWRSHSAEAYVFVDADVVVRPDAIGRLLTRLAVGDVVGVNGVLSPDRMSDTVSDFVNISLCFQHRRHGDRVAAAFTSLCVLRRDALVSMGGWNERWSSRYADDVETRFHLPPRALAVDFDAVGHHAKHVRWWGLMKHRARVGAFFASSIAEHADVVRLSPSVAVVDLRYPLNTLAAFSLSLAALAAPSQPAVAASALIACTAAFCLNNLEFLGHVARARSLPTAGAWFVLTLTESFALAAGLLAGTSAVLFAALRNRTFRKRPSPEVP